MPKAQREISERHRIVMMYADRGKGREHNDEMFPNRSHIGFMAMRTNAGTALYAAIVNGLAVGRLPTHYFAIGAPVVPLDIDWIYSFDVFLSCHHDPGEVPRIRRMIDWMIGIFDSQNLPFPDIRTS